MDSRVGFSHNSLREYLVSAQIVDTIKQDDASSWSAAYHLSLTDAICSFVVDTAEYHSEVLTIISEKYLASTNSKQVDFLLSMMLGFLRINREKFIKLFGVPTRFLNVDMSQMHLDGLDLQGATIRDCLLQDTDFRNTDLANSDFKGSILERVRLDGANIKDVDMSAASISSIYVHDEYDTKTTKVLEGRDARQWLFSRGAKVQGSEELNALMGRPWYEAAREVTRTLERRIAGTHQDVSLAKGTSAKYRNFAGEFVNYLISQGILNKVTRSKNTDGWVVKLNQSHFADIRDFSRDGKISEALQPFFRMYGDRSNRGASAKGR